jgi:parallel beta-helix repeat protein
MKKDGILLIGVVLLILCAGNGTASAKDIYVPDDYTTIQQAVNTASPGDTIIVRDDTYTENLEVNERLTIRSENGSANCFVDTSDQNDHVFSITADWVNISGFTVKNATGSGKAGIYLGNGVDHCNISSNNATDNHCGIYLFSWSINNTLMGNIANSNNNHGIYLYFSSTNSLTGNTANSNNQYGIYLYNSSTNSLMGNTARDNNYGIYFWASNTNNLTGNTANSNNQYGIYLGSSNTNTLTGNTANLNNNMGIYLYYSNTNTLMGNTARDNNYGIYFWASNTNNLSSNTANLNNQYGIYFWASNTNNLSGNTARDNNYGITLYSSSTNNNLTGNTANSNNYDGIYLGSSNTNTLTGNTANSNNNHGIYLGSSNTNTLTGNIANSNVRDGIYLGSSSTNNLSGNTANSNMRDGIYLGSSNTNSLTGNTANSNNQYGIYLGSSNTNSLTGNTANSNNQYGIYLGSSSSNTLTGNIARDNNHGIYLGSSNTNSLTGNTANSNNNHGIYLGSSSSNTLTGNIARDNNHGIYLEYSSTNTIYNNYFNNTQNAYADGTNVWNISKTEGKNIIGGPYLGGNYWNDYTGTDTDNDGLGDIPYNIPGGTNKDYLPLVNISGLQGSISGKVTYTCNTTGIAGATVNLTQGGSVINSTVTDSNGEYTFSDVPFGAYEVTASKVCFWDNSTMVSVNGDMSGVDLALWLRGASITDLQNVTGETWINWTWTNPPDVDFNHTIVYLDGVWKKNTSATFYNATGLVPDTTHEIATHTVDKGGNINTTWVNQTAKTLPPPDLTPPASITNLQNITGQTWINWTWDNPTDPDFNHTMVYLDGIWKTNTSGPFYHATGLTSNTSYEIGTRTVDQVGNINTTWVNQTAKTSESEPPRTWYVDDDDGANFTKIQDAANNASSYDTLIVRDGIYSENIDVTIDKVTIQSENGSVNCVVNASNQNDHVFEITADWVNISGFTVQDATGTNKAGIYLNNVDHCTISENTASNNGYGIFLYSSSNNILTGNTALNNYYGIYLEYSSNKSDLTGNTAQSNSEYGTFLIASNNNCIYNNYFNNTINAYDDGTNIWNITKTAGTNIIGGLYLGGNYWNDYTGNDADTDGLGDTPYDIQGGTNKDYLPLINISGLWGSIFGQVTYTCNTTGIAGATVNLTQGGSVIDSTVTDNNGSYTFANVLLGAYSVNASKVHFWDNATDVTVTAGASTEADMMLWLKGDVYNDGVLDIYDIIMLRQAAAENIPWDYRYDLYVDATVDIYDIIVLRQAVAGNIVLE